MVSRLIFILLVFVGASAYSAETVSENTSYLEIEIDTALSVNDTLEVVKVKKLTVLLVTILTGPIGGHRILLGTKPIVPFVYAITLGGGGLILPLLDIIFVLIKKDITPYQNNSKIFMWADRSATQR